VHVIEVFRGNLPRTTAIAGFELIVGQPTCCSSDALGLAP
jgi:hypothetical protein